MFSLRLLVVSSAIHYRHAGLLYAYGPYAREIAVWASLFAEVRIAAPCRNEQPPGDCEPIEDPKVSICPQPEAGGETLRAKLGLLWALPQMIVSMARAMRKCDAVHVRCPGNLGLLGVVMGRLFVDFRVAKYAGQWSGYRRESATVRLQRWLLQSRWWGAPVTVYGDWPGQPDHVVPFFTSTMTGHHVHRARMSAKRHRMGPLRILYLGRLSASKNVDALIKAVAGLKRRGTQLSCQIVGEGPERERLEDLARKLDVTDVVEFAGGVSYERVFEFLEHSDALVLVSETEGWPKAILEGMAFGLVCIGTDRGLVPRILGEGRGIVMPPGAVAELESALDRIARDPEYCSEMRERAGAWAQQYTLEGLGEALAKLLEEHWGLTPSKQVEPVRGTKIVSSTWTQ